MPLGKRSSAVLLEGIAAVEVVVLDEVVVDTAGGWQCSQSSAPGPRAERWRKI